MWGPSHSAGNPLLISVFAASKFVTSHSNPLLMAVLVCTISLPEDAYKVDGAVTVTLSAEHRSYR
jgi:hypothetical protein